MAQPTKADLLLLSTTRLGKPFVQTSASAIDTKLLSTTWLGVPFAAVTNGGSPPAPIFCPIVMVI